MKSTTQLMFALCGLLLATTASAGRYELVKGKGVEVCEAYEKNLSSLQPTEPMICERRINPQMKNFKEPDWTRPTMEQVRALEFDMARLTSRVLNQPEPKSESEITARTEDSPGWPAKREIANVDIDNNGTPEIVLKQQDGVCPMHRAFSVNIAVLTKDGMHYDLEKSRFINIDFSKRAAKLENDSRPASRQTAGMDWDQFWGYTLYDIFLYKGVAYFDLWEMGEEYPSLSSGRLHVFLNKDKKTQEICTYRFR